MQRKIKATVVMSATEDFTLLTLIGKATGSETMCRLIQFIVIKSVETGGYFYSNKLTKLEIKRSIPDLSEDSYKKYISKLVSSDILVKPDETSRGVYMVNRQLVDVYGAMSDLRQNKPLLLN